MDGTNGFCPAHMGCAPAGGGDLRARLPEGHVIHTLVSEHEMILGFLDKLEATNAAIQRMGSLNEACAEIATLVHIAEHLVGADPHHAREEEVLFPEIEQRGVVGPPEVMRMEHDALRARKRELLGLAKDPGDDFDQFKLRAGAAAEFIVGTLRDHIFKENNILYPAALEVIPDDADWARLKEACDRIGYCCFTPK